MKRRNKQPASRVTATDQSRDIAGATKLTGRGPWKKWGFRLAAVVSAPALCFGIVELALRLVNYGYPTTFLLQQPVNGAEAFVQNNQFGWRFFGLQMARLPEPFAIAKDKPPGTIRILVLGESAAKGEPQPAFGMPRLLQAMLSLRHPDKRFEVVNSAMTAINSHAILPIARDCANAGADIWVIYMGNNEVVGPFGAGTVFGQQTPPLTLIRSALALKATRTGQWLEATLTKVQNSSDDGEEWRGMKMFLDQQVPLEDPRMNSVYHHFQHNLADIIRMGRRCGAGMVVSTVAVNLRDCAPFASVHRADLSHADRARWDESYQLGVRALDAGDHQAALQKFEAAARLDRGFAELRFRQGTSALALGQVREARQHLAAARDLDTLRFRCDSRLNELIRWAATNHAPERVALADAERVFAAQSADGLPGDEFFYEHVHLTFKGNYLLAKTLAEQIEKLLPAQAPASDTAQAWPSEAECAKRLGWSDWSRLAALQAILARKRSAPFIGQANHDAQLRAFTATIAQLSAALQSTGVAEGRRACETALAVTPDDAVLLGQLSSFQQLAGDSAGAIKSIRRELELVPSNPVAWQRLGLNLTSQKQFAEAATAFQRAIELNPADVAPRQNLGQSLWQSGRRDEAVMEFRQALKIRPNFALGWLGLGQVLEEMGRKDEAAACFQSALSCRSPRAGELAVLARFCRSRGWLGAAVTNYDQAIVINPSDAKLRVETGQLLLAMGRIAEAGQHLSEAVRITPDAAPARHLYGLSLGNQGLSADAEVQFREALRLAPERVETRMDLGMSLLAQGRSSEALAQFEDVLQRSPTNELALKYVQTLRAKTGIESVR